MGWALVISTLVRGTTSIIVATRPIQLIGWSIIEVVWLSIAAPGVVVSIERVSLTHLIVISRRRATPLTAIILPLEVWVVIAARLMMELVLIMWPAEVVLALLEIAHRIVFFNYYGLFGLVTLRQFVCLLLIKLLVIVDLTILFSFISIKVKTSWSRVNSEVKAVSES